MKIIETGTASIRFDQEGDAYFMTDDLVYYLSEFMKSESEFDGVTHIANTGGIGIKVDEANEEVEYTFFTISP